MQYLDPYKSRGTLVFDFDPDDTYLRPHLFFTSYVANFEVIPERTYLQPHFILVTFTISSALSQALRTGTEFKVSFGSSYDYVTSSPSSLTIEYDSND